MQVLYPSPAKEVGHGLQLRGKMRKYPLLDISGKKCLALANLTIHCGADTHLVISFFRRFLDLYDDGNINNNIATWQFI
jgi:hypothetical protein